MAANGLRPISFLRGQAAEKIATLLLLFLLLTISVASVTNVLTGPEWNALWKGLIFGLLAGWLLAVFRQPFWMSLPLTSILGFGYALLYAGGMRQKVVSILVEFSLLVSNLATASSYEAGNSSTLRLLSADFLNTSVVILERVNEWLYALVRNEMIFDPVAVAFVWTLVVWMIAAWAGWTAVAYRNALLASLPVIMVSLTALAFGRSDSAALYFMLGLTLLLVATVQHLRREQAWDQVNTAYPPRKGRQIGVIAVGAAAAVVLLAMVVSSLSLPRIIEWMSPNREISVPGDDNLAKSLGIVSRATVLPDPFEQPRRAGLPREALIGSGPELSTHKVMTVAVKDYLPAVAGQLLQPPYWRSFTYDTYTGNGWRSSTTTTNQYRASQLLGSEQAPDRVMIKQTVRSIDLDKPFLYAAGEPVSVNLSSEVARRSQDDIFGIMLANAGSYEVNSLVSVADERRLRAEEFSYPDWVRQRFLRLPPNIPDRVAELALQLTAAAQTPYDRVRAIEAYLREIPYTLDVPHPPQDQDLVDYFLFDLRKGYCDYYASAMVVLARAAGVPARFATGYANGTLDLRSGRFLVSEADAHSWVEIYFPRAGWVPFEPTAGRPPLNKSATGTSEARESPAAPKEFPLPAQANVELPWWQVLLGTLSSICILGIVWVAVDEVRMRARSENMVACNIYQRLRRFGNHLGVALSPSDTPNEFTVLVISRLEEISQNGVSPQFRTSMVESVALLTDRIVEVSFNPADSHKRQVFRLWKKLRWQLSWMWLVKHFHSAYKRLFGKAAAHSSRPGVSAGVKE